MPIVRTAGAGVSTDQVAEADECNSRVLAVRFGGVGPAAATTGDGNAICS